jgi:CRISPR-associated protein Cmr4
MTKRILYLFTRTPLHVGAGASVGAIDQPIIRERHTGFPVIPGTSLKGTFADLWNEAKNGEIERSADGKWLFGETDANNAAAGALQFSEARLLAFPVRSARGSFAWITCPLILHRAIRDGAINTDVTDLPNPSDEQAYFSANGPLAIDGKVVLEEYTFTRCGDLPDKLRDAFADLLKNGDAPVDPVWSEVAKRLVILSDGMMSFFAQNACEIAQHVRIDDETGTAAGGALFNQENVPSETLFYAAVHAFDERTVNKRANERRKAKDALKAFGDKLANKPFQIGGDASTGLGWCTVKLADPAGQS